jgi:hypothetical protein
MNYLFDYLDIFLSIITSLILVFIIFSKRSAIKIFVNFLTCNVIIMLIAFTILKEQIQIGKFLIVNTLFLLTLALAFFYMSDTSHLEDTANTIEQTKKSLYILISLFILFISCFSFTTLPNNSIHIDPITIFDYNLKNYDELYKEKINDINNNKIFQNMTEIILIYSGISIALLFFNKNRKTNER